MRSVFVAGVLFAVLAGPVSAADVSGLSWGEFLQNEGNAAKAASMEGSAEGRSLKMTMAIEDFSASAEGDRTDAAATFSSSFLITQPARLQLTKLHATVSGVIVKTAGATANLDIVIGPATATLAWSDAETRSERFTKDIDLVIADGKLPAPFPVSATAVVKKPGKAGAALVTLDTITIDIGEALVGENSPQPDSKKPALPVAAPALVALKN